MRRYLDHAWDGHPFKGEEERRCPGSRTPSTGLAADDGKELCVACQRWVEVDDSERAAVLRERADCIAAVASARSIAEAVAALRGRG